MNRLLLGAYSLTAGNGGICRVARLMARVLLLEAGALDVSTRGAVFGDKTPPDDLAMPVRTAGGSRARYIWEVQRAVLTASHFAYDSLGMARAHPRWPGLHRPFMTCIHGIEVWHPIRPDRLRWAQRADYLLADTAYTRERAAQVDDCFARAKLCWLATETDELPVSAKRSDGPPRVVIIGRIDEGYKGHDALIHCWARVVSAVPDARLTIVGRGPGLEAMRRLAAGSPAAGQIDFRGFVPEEDMDQVWRESAVFAMPSRGEGFGLVYIEAMRYGVPVIASVHDAAPEINLEGQTGFNVNLEKPDELPERIIHLLQNRDEAARLGRNGQQRWLEHFRFSCYRERFRARLQEFLALG